MSILTRSDRAPTPDERRAAWAYRYYSAGHHRINRKPRIRVKPRIRINTNTNTARGGTRAEDSQ